MKWEAERLRKKEKMRKKLSDEEFAKWQRKEANIRRSQEKIKADAATVRSVFPELMARDISLHRRDGTLERARAVLVRNVLDDLIARVEHSADMDAAYGPAITTT